MDDFDIEDWWTGSSFVDAGMPVDNLGIDVGNLGGIDFSDAISFGDLSSYFKDDSLIPDIPDLFGTADGGISFYGREDLPISDLFGSADGGISFYGREDLPIPDLFGTPDGGMSFYGREDLPIPDLGSTRDIEANVGADTTTSDNVRNYLLDAIKTPGLQGLDADQYKTALYKTADEAEAPSSIGAREPEMPGITAMGGMQGLSVEVPAEFDEQGKKIKGTGGYITQMGFVPYEATPILGDPRSFINDPRVLGRDVFGTDMLRSVLGGGTVADRKTGEVVKLSPSDMDKFQRSLTTGDTDRDKSITKTITDVINRLTTTGPNKQDALLAALLGGLMGLLGKGSSAKGPVGYQGGIPKFTAVRGKPGEGTKFIQAAGGGLMDLAQGGRAARYLRGGTDGMADKIKTDIDGKQPARLSHGEFVIPADVVSHLGNGNSDAGADVLYDMMDKVRKARTGTTKQGKQINPQKYTRV